MTTTQGARSTAQAQSVPQVAPAGRTLRVLAAHPSSELYGSDRMFAESVAGFVQAGHDVTAVLAGPGPLVAVLQEAGARVETMPTPILRKSALTPRGFGDLVATTAAATGPTARLLREFRPELAYVSTLTAPGWLAATKAARVPTVCHVHEAESEARRVVRTGLTAPLLLADRLLLNSQFAADVLTDSIGALKRRIDVVPNGVAGPEAALPPRSTLDGRIRLLFTGRLSPRKGTDVALEATRLLRERGLDVTLDVAGSVFAGYEWFETQLRRAAAEPGLDGAVTFHGFVSVWEKLAQCDIALVPSVLPEPFGNTAVEAILARRPVVASRIGGLPEAVAQAPSARLATAGDAASLADAIAELVDSWPQTVADTQVAHDWAAQRFSPEGYRDAVVRLSTRVARPARSTGR